MPETPLWDELTRSEQRLLIRLFGGGSVRNQHDLFLRICRRAPRSHEADFQPMSLASIALP
jgi:hypothetical protein